MPDTVSTAILWKDIRILIADDEPEMREIFATWFRNLECQVVEAEDGLFALEKATQSHFDVVVTDVRMPRLDGVELARRLCHSVGYTPVLIFVSGFHDLPLREAHDLGIEAILSKPCSKKQLIESVRTSLLRRALQFPNEARETTAVAAVLEKSYSTSVEASGVAVGRGGFSLSWEPRLDPETTVRFRLEFCGGPLHTLDGIGTIRWVESNGSRRVGIEFTALTAKSREDVLDFLREVRPHSFIPKNAREARTVEVPSI